MQECHAVRDHGCGNRPARGDSRSGTTRALTRARREADPEEDGERGVERCLYTRTARAQSGGATSPLSCVREFTKTVINVMIGALKNAGKRAPDMSFAPTLPFFLTK